MSYSLPFHTWVKGHSNWDSFIVSVFPNWMLEKTGILTFWSVLVENDDSCQH